MVVPTGTASPWEEFPSYKPGLAVYIRDGWTTGSADLLAEALRVDGVVRTLSHALRVAEEATLDCTWYGYVDEGFDQTLCTSDGETEYGDVVDRPRACVIATINVQE